jgi:hypothetical protein
MDSECPICLNNINNTELCKTNCNHNFCLDCLQEWFKKKQTCPNCRKRIETFTYQNITNRLFYINNLEDLNLNINQLNTILTNNINYRIANKRLLLLLKLMGFTSLLFMSSTIYLTINSDFENL